MHRISAESEETLKVFCMSRPANKKMVWNVKEEQRQNLSIVPGLYFCILSFQPLDKVAMLINKQYKILFKEFAWRKRVYIAAEKTSFVLINQHGPGWYQLQTGQQLRPMTIIVGYLLTKFNSSVTRTYIKSTGLLLASWNSYPCGPQWKLLVYGELLCYP